MLIGLILERFFRDFRSAAFGYYFGGLVAVAGLVGPFRLGFDPGKFDRLRLRVALYGGNASELELRGAGLAFFGRRRRFDEGDLYCFER